MSALELFSHCEVVEKVDILGYEKVGYLTTKLVLLGIKFNFEDNKLYANCSTEKLKNIINNY